MPLGIFRLRKCWEEKITCRNKDVALKDYFFKPCLGENKDVSCKAHHLADTGGRLHSSSLGTLSCCAARFFDREIFQSCSKHCVQDGLLWRDPSFHSQAFWSRTSMLAFLYFCGIQVFLSSRKEQIVLYLQPQLTPKFLLISKTVVKWALPHFMAFPFWS